MAKAEEKTVKAREPETQLPNGKKGPLPGQKTKDIVVLRSPKSLKPPLAYMPGKRYENCYGKDADRMIRNQMAITFEDWQKARKDERK